MAETSFRRHGSDLPVVPASHSHLELLAFGLLDGLCLLAIFVPTWALVELAARATGWW